MNFIEVAVLTNTDCVAQKIYSSAKKITPSIMRKACKRLTAKIEKYGLDGEKVISVYARVVDEPKVGEVPEELFIFKGATTLETGRTV